MWWETLPSFAIVISFLAAPQVIIYGMNKLILGNAYTRRLYSTSDYLHYLRDTRISGNNNPYNQIGLSEADLEEEIKVESTQTQSKEKVC